MSQLWVRNISGGYDLTNDIEGLSWSSVNPGGDERAGFVFKRPWYAENPEIAKGNVIRIGWGLDVLFQGRIEEYDRGGEASEEIQVTAYGLGARLKDNTMREIYVERDLSQWQYGIPASRKSTLWASSKIIRGEGEVDQDTNTGIPQLSLTMPRLNGTATQDYVEAWFSSDGIDIGSIYWDFNPNALMALEGANWFNAMYLALSENGSYPDATTDQNATANTGTLTAGGAGRIFALGVCMYEAAFTGDGFWAAVWRRLAVFGRHGLTKRGAAPDQGFYADDIVGDVISRVTGVTTRRIDPQSYVFQNASYRTATKHEDVIADVNQYEGCNWGTWGPDSPLDTSTNGQFDFTDPDYTTQHWFATRAELEDIDLHSELSTLYDQVDVHYTDTGGASRTVRRTATVPDLVNAGMSPRTYDLEAGTQAPAEAQTLGDSFLALSGGFAPARGSVVVAAPVRHYSRGLLPPCYLRADGSNFRIPDVLPSTTLFELSSVPDRRTTFPIKRVNVDAGGSKLSATVELDQTNDLLSVLQARLSSANELAIG